MFNWLHQHAQLSRALSLLLMAGSAIGLYLAAQADNGPGIWLLLVVFALGNLLALFTA